MNYTVAQLAELVGGALHGDGSVAISAALPFDEARGGAITFLGNGKRQPRLEDCQASALVIAAGQPMPPIATIVVSDPLDAILQIAEQFIPPTPANSLGIDPRAAVDPSARLGSNCTVGPFAVIEAGVIVGDDSVIHPHAVIRAGCRLSDRVTIHPHSVLYPRTVVGSRTIIHGGAVIGCDGFGYRFRKGVHEKVPQLGNVEIGSDVEIGANTTIDRATFGTTRIGDGTKIDNQVMIAHNCQIGKHNIFAAQVGIAGSSSTGSHVVMAGQVGVADHVHIGTGATLAADAGVYTDIPAGETYVGTPARPIKDAKRLHLSLERVPEMRKELAEVRRRLGLDRPGRGGSENDRTSERKAAG